jgi:hypothetical protein
MSAFKGHRDDASEEDSGTTSSSQQETTSFTSSMSSSTNAKENNATSAGGAATSTVVLAMSFYMAVSIALVFANKFVLSGKSLDAPLFLTWTQLVVAVAACFAIAQLKPLFAPHLNFFPRFEYRLDRAKAVMPLSLIFIGMVYDAADQPTPHPSVHLIVLLHITVSSTISVSNMSRCPSIKSPAPSPFSPTSASPTSCSASPPPPYVVLSSHLSRFPISPLSF